MTNIPVRQVTPKSLPLEITPYEFIADNCSVPIEYCINYCKKKKINTYEELQTNLNEIFSTYIRILDSNGKSKAVTFNISLLRYLSLIAATVSNEFNLYPSVIPDDYKQYLLSNKKPNPLRFLAFSHILMPNLDHVYFQQNLNSLKFACNTFWSRLAGGSSQLQSFLYLYSEIGGVGKSLFWKFIEAWAKKHNVSYSYSSITNSNFVGPEFNQNLVCYIDDMTKSSLKDWPNMNRIIDGQSYKVEVKYGSPYYTKPRCLLITSSNFLPEENNYRRIQNSLVRFSSETFKITDPEIKNHFLMKEGSIDIDAYADIVEEWLLSAPLPDYSYEDKNNSCAPINFVDVLGENRYTIFKIMLEIINQYPQGSFTANGSGFSYISKKLEDKDKFITPHDASNVLRTLANNKIIKQINDSVDLRTRKYDISPLYDNLDTISSEEIDYNISTWNKNAPNLKKESIIAHEMIKQLSSSFNYELKDNDPLVIADNRIREQQGRK